MLDKIVMNELSRTTISRFFSTKRIPHAIIIEGTSCDNRMLCAKELAKAMLCEGDVIPCDSCKSCRKVEADVHPDVIVCEKEDNKATMGVDIIRSMKSDAFIKANDSDNKVYIFKEAQNMTPQSQNALLKIFEEPPDHVSIILTCSSKSSLLETILSRGTVITLGESDESSSTDARVIKAREKASELLLSLCDENELEFMLKTAVFEKDKRLLVPVLENMASAFSSAAVIKSGGKNIAYDRDISQKMSMKFTLGQLVDFTNTINLLSETVQKNANNNLTLTRLSSLLMQVRH